MTFEHKSGLPFALDRAEGHPEQQSVVFFGERNYIQAPELNELQTIARGRHDRLGRLLANDGDRIERAFAVVNVAAGTVTLTDGDIFCSGDIFPVAAKVLTAVPMVDVTIQIGVKVTRTYVTHAEDPTLLGLVPGGPSEGEPGAAREVVTIEWVRGDLATGVEFYSVYTLKNGTILDQKPPALLEGVRQALAVYDRPLGHYIVDGNRVTALGGNAGAQVFSIEQGEANINGFKITRQAAIRHVQPEDWSEVAIPGETHTYVSGATYTFPLDVTPLASITSILLTKETTATITRGAIGGGSDALPQNSVVSIIEVKRGGTTYAVTSDYKRTGNTVDWLPGGAEPAAGSSYTVKFQYRASVTATSSTGKTVTVSGGATGGDIIIAYRAKLKRIDALCLNQLGEAVYVKGISALQNPLPPLIPNNLLSLCQISNNWSSTPSVTNDGTRSIPFNQMWRLFNKMLDNDRLLQLERLKLAIDSKEPQAKKGTALDAFNNDDARDAGVVQTASVGAGILELAITPTFYPTLLNAPVTLDYIEEIIATQPLRTACTKINPYANFTPLPGALEIDPKVDFWAESQTDWLSPSTRQFKLGTITRYENDFIGGGTRRTLLGTTSLSTTQSSGVSSNEIVDNRVQQSSFLRQISIAFVISGFGVGEILSTLTFDNVNVKPAGVQTADANGQISGAFTIPANVPVGVKNVVAIGAGGTNATALFTGDGTVTVKTMQRVTTVTSQDTVVITNHIRLSDPQAQLFAVPEDRQLVGVDFHMCAIGNQAKKLIIDQVTVDNGYPTSNVVGEALFPMVGAGIGWKSARYKIPVFTDDSQFHAFVIKSDDNIHSISLAKLGGFDASLQRNVSAHPYSVGPRFSSVNAETWTAHQDEALAFRLVAAKYTALTKTVDLGSFALVNASDLQVRAVVQLPSSDCSLVFEIERPNGTIYQVRPWQVLELTEFLNETVQLRAILTGTEKLSPILFAPVQLVAGKIATSGTYIRNAFGLGSLIDIVSYIKAYLPGGATATMHYDLADDNWVLMPITATEILAVANWVERKHKVTGITGTNARIKITITGGPADRPELADFGVSLM